MSQQRGRPEFSRGSNDPGRVVSKAELAEVCAREVLDAGIRVHRLLGPGMLESVYESILARDLRSRGLRVDRQSVVPVEIEGLQFDEGFRCDLLIQGVLVVELKCIERIAPIHLKQVLSYLRLLGLSLGLLLNFGAPTMKEGCRRVVNGHLEGGDLG